MPGIGIRLWQPFYNVAVEEVPASVVDWTVTDPIALNGTKFPINSIYGNVLVRMIGRVHTAIRPFTVTVGWNGTSMAEQAFHVDDGAGGTFAGIWTIFDIEPASGEILIACNQNAGSTLIRAGEIEGPIIPVAAGASFGYELDYELGAGNGMLVVSGTADSSVGDFSSEDFTAQWVASIPPKTDLPNRTHGLSGYFGITVTKATDNIYSIVPSVGGIEGVIAAIELSREVVGGRIAAKKGTLKEDDFLEHI
jgi:hypothetical protein